MAGERILVVDDEYLVRWSLQQNFEKEGYEVFTAATGEEALDKVRSQRPDVVLLDLRLPGIDGFAVLEKVIEIDADVILIMITACEDVETLVKAMRLGASDYITKPFEFSKVRLSVLKALNSSRLKRTAKLLKSERGKDLGFDHIIAVSEKMRKLLRDTDRIGQSDASPVLLQGESGSGKELLAHLVHSVSKRENMPFITINCAIFPGHLLESELYGNEKGPATDAREVNRGLVEMADGGTLFVDAIDEMDLNMQAKLLRLVERGRFRRVGGVKDVEVDLRIVIATNKDLLKLKEEGKFRGDLLYRINFASISIPPLRNRPEDILPLTRYFAQKYDERFHKGLHEISEDVQEIFMTYPWPGNIRELKNVVERAMILEHGDVLTIEDLPIEVIQHSGRGKAYDLFQLPADGVSLEKVEEDLVRQALEMTHGNQTKAAKLLHISRDAIRYRMQKFEIRELN